MLEWGADTIYHATSCFEGHQFLGSKPYDFENLAIVTALLSAGDQGKVFLGRPPSQVNPRLPPSTGQSSCRPGHLAEDTAAVAVFRTGWTSPQALSERQIVAVACR